MTLNRPVAASPLQPDRRLAARPLTERGRRRQPSSGPGNLLSVPVPASDRFRFRRAPPPSRRRRLCCLFCFDFYLRPRVA